MDSAHIIMLPLGSPINLERTVDEVLMENPDQLIVIAALDVPFEQSQHTKITIPTQQHGSWTKEDDIHSISIEQENLSRQEKITARFPQTMMACPEIQTTHIGKISKKKFTSSERCTPYNKKRETSSRTYKPLRSLNGNCMKFPQDVSRNFHAFKDFQPRPSTSADTSEYTRNAEEQQRIPEKSAPSHTVKACAEMQNFHKYGFVNTQTTRSKINMPFTEKGESSAMTFKSPKLPLNVSRNISITKEIKKKQSSAKTSKATNKSKEQLKSFAKDSKSTQLTKKKKKQPTTYTGVPLHPTPPENLNKRVTLPYDIRNSFSPREIRNQPVTPSFFEDSFVTLEASEQPTITSEMFTNSFIPNRAQNQYTYFGSVAKDISLNSARKGYPASSVGISSSFIDCTQPETLAPSTYFGDLSSDIMGYSEGPLFPDLELQRQLDSITASIIGDDSEGNDLETIALADISQN